ncbi:MAG: 16S rRNA (cytidine(1402)-2'-O)-methyltransferase [Ornithinimicrobium sp.]
MPGVLVLAATPIGDSRDASPRLLEELRTAPIIAAEDTRRLRKLCDRLGVSTTGRVLSYHEHNEASRTPDLIASMNDGEQVLLVTDAGMPSVSDPGYRLVSEAVSHGIPVTCVPGPSAVLMALAVSGLPVERFCFEGFLPRKSGQRERMIADLAEEKRTMVFFEAPHRLATMLAALAHGLGQDRPAAVCRELTKTYEEVKRGGLGELAEWATEGVRGEITIVVAGVASVAGQEQDLEQVVRDIEARVAAGERLKNVCREVARTTSVSSRSLYDSVVESRQVAAGVDPAGSTS